MMKTPGDTARPGASSARHLALLAVALLGWAFPVFAANLSVAETPPVTTPTLTLAESARFTVDLDAPRAVALISIDEETHVLAGGKEGIDIYNLDGRKLRRIETPEPVTCLAISNESGTIFVGSTARVRVYSFEGELLDAWGEEGGEPGQLRLVTGLAVAEPEVFVADAGNRRVTRFAENGDYVDCIDGFHIPSPHFDCAVDAAGVLYVADTGRYQVVQYDANMERLGAWGQSGNAPENFCGCCNPTDIALLPQGRVATTEKGMPRLKVYDEDGRMLAYLGPTHFSRRAEGMDLAADADGCIALLEPFEKHVRIYRLEEQGESDG